MKFLALFCMAVLSCLAVAAQAQTPWQVYEGWPFDAKEAVRRQTETAEAMKQPVVLKIALGEKEGLTLNWRLIPAGKYMMGSPATESGHEGDENLHEETISDPFYMMETQMTFGQYRALMLKVPPVSGWDPNGDPPGVARGADPKLPVGTPYRDAVDRLLPTLAKLAPAGWKVMLPDQARIEYAARAGVATIGPGGDTPESAAPYVWSQENSEGVVHPVAQKQPNAWGLYDVVGNRWHWYWSGRHTLDSGDDGVLWHRVYGGDYIHTLNGNGTRLANIMVSDRPEGIRFALIRSETPLPKDHPETGAKATSQTLSVEGK